MKTDAWEKHRDVLSNLGVIDFIKYGFPVGHKHDKIPVPTLTNHSSAVNYSADVDNYIQTEQQHGAIVGPFNERPFQWTMTSPLMSRPKPNKTERRVILDLSFPPGESVNDGIPRDEYLGDKCKLRLPSALTLRDNIREIGHGAVMWSKDLQRGYRQMRSCPLDYPLLGMHWRGKFFFDVAVPFGIRNGALCMQAITSSVTDILHSKGHAGLAYIDDLAGAHATKIGAEQAFSECERILKELGLVEAEEKQSKPSTTMVWLGVRFDSIAMQMSIPPKKIEDVAKLVETWRGRKQCTPSQLRSLLGKLFFLATCSSTLRLFCNRMLEGLRQATDNQPITLSSDFHLDVDWIAKYLIVYNGIDIITRPTTFPFELVVDSCLTGGGGHLGNIWFAAAYPEEILNKQYNISELEMLNAVVALKAVAHVIRGHIINLRCDNAATVAVLETGRGRCPFLLACAREAWRVTANNAVEVHVSHIAGNNNDLADYLSRIHKDPKGDEQLRARARREDAQILDLASDIYLF